MKKTSVAGTLATLLASVSLLLLASAVQADSAGRKVTITGQVVDTACYIGHDTKGADHARCATMCAKAGIPLAILDTEANTLYLPISMDHKNPNEKLMPHIEKQVKVTGVVMEKGGMKGIVIENIEPAG